MQDEVFRVASEILREDGFAGLTMERIAARAGVSRPTLYNYFSDADSVLNFVESRVVEPITRAIEEIAEAEVPAANKLAAVATLMFDRINEDRTLALALFAKREFTGPRAEQKRAMHARFLEIVQTIVAEGIERGELREIEAPVLARVFLGALSGLIEQMFLSGELKPSEEIVPSVMNVLLNGIEPRTGRR